MGDLPMRKLPRLRGYDYSRNGAYFLTLCAKNKAHLFGHVVGAGVPDGPTVELTPLGNLVQKRLEEMNRVYADFQIAHYVIMPNHIHLLVVLESGPSRTPAPTSAGTPGPANGESGPSRTPAPTSAGTPGRANARIPAFVSTLKRMTNREAGTELWQRSYHDHIIRNDVDYLDHWTYIDGNAAKWSEDEYYTETTI